MKDFGVSRVIEPKGAIPVTAWKIDNSEKISSKEIRIRLETIHIEWNSFDQICSHCGYDIAKIKARIMQIIDERGKFHNPYTGSGGLFMGIIDEIGSDVDAGDLKVGDRVFSLSSITGAAMSIETIKDIDFNYGQIVCSGYVICFESGNIIKYTEGIDPKYLLSAIDEEGNFLGVLRALKDIGAKRVAIIGGNPVKTLMYAQLVRERSENGSTVIAVMDKNSIGNLTENELTETLLPIVERTYFVELGKPMAAFDKISVENKDAEPMDAVINLEEVLGSETLATLLVKDAGIIFYASFKNNYSLGVLVADSIGKEVVSYSLDGCSMNSHDLAVDLISKVTPNLKYIDSIYAMKSKLRYDIKGAGKSHGELSGVGRIDDYVYQSPVSRAMIKEVLNIAQYDCNVIIQGETGVGKEKVFNLIHQNSPRNGKPCVKINCATIQENLAESEFFGYEKGSFTGAQSTGKAGYFELANNGTLFLDEIGSLSLNMQSKLLRVLQENSFYRVGGTELKHVNVRVICANNVPLMQLAEEGKFRKDLFYRLNICSIDVPALRDRKEDILCLAEAFIKGYSKKYGMEKELSPEAYHQLEAYHWPGNVRELENAIHRLYINERDRIIGGEAVAALLNNTAYEAMIVNFRREPGSDSGVDFNQVLEEQERRMIAYALKKEGTTRKAAEYLNLPQATLARKKVKYGL